MEGSRSNSTNESCTRNFMKRSNCIGCLLQLNASVFPGWNTARAVGPPSYQPMEDRPNGRKESLDSKNQSKQRFLSGHGIGFSGKRHLVKNVTMYCFLSKTIQLINLCEINNIARMWQMFRSKIVGAVRVSRLFMVLL